MIERQDSSLSASDAEGQKSFSYTPNPNIKVVLNGGSRMLDTATVPVEWHFSDELIEKKPQFIVICDHQGPMTEMSGEVYYSYGTRHLFDVRRLVSYIQLQRAGRHHFVVMVFYGDRDDALSKAHSYMKKEGSAYGNRLLVRSLLVNNEDHEIHGCETTIVEFEVPSQLFSERPKTEMGQLIWRWTNLWHKSDPVDQCDYRRRKIFAFTLKPFFWAALRLLAGVMGTLYTVICSFILWFTGWQSEPVMANIKASWALSDDFTLDLRKYYQWRRMDAGLYLPGYKVPIFVVLEIIAGAVALLGLTLLYKYFLALALVLTFFVSVAGLMALSLIKRAKDPVRKARQEEEARSKEEMKEERWMDFLQRHAALSALPRKVEVGSVIKKVNPVTKFVLGYWAVKAKVCKPFAK